MIIQKVYNDVNAVWTGISGDAILHREQQNAYENNASRQAEKDR